MKRLDDWRERLERTIESAKEKQGAFGIHDCMMFPANCVEAITGHNYAEQFGKYESAISAARLMHQYGGIQGLVTHALGEAIPPNWAQEGDVIMVHVGGRETGGICVGNNCILVDERGVFAVPRDRILKAWRVG